jgi:hypothetical protein
VVGLGVETEKSSLDEGERHGRLGMDSLRQACLREAAFFAANPSFVFVNDIATTLIEREMCDLHEYLAESGAIYFTSREVREECARFPLSQHLCPMIVKHNLSHVRGHLMLQSRRRSHFEALIGRIYRYTGR